MKHEWKTISVGGNKLAQIDGCDRCQLQRIHISNKSSKFKYRPSSEDDWIITKCPECKNSNQLEILSSNRFVRHAALIPTIKSDIDQETKAFYKPLPPGERSEINDVFLSMDPDGFFGESKWYEIAVGDTAQIRWKSKSTLFSIENIAATYLKNSAAIFVRRNAEHWVIVSSIEGLRKSFQAEPKPLMECANSNTVASIEEVKNVLSIFEDSFIVEINKKGI